jgi:hypothetical protein
MEPVVLPPPALELRLCMSYTVSLATPRDIWDIIGHFFPGDFCLHLAFSCRSKR